MEQKKYLKNKNEYKVNCPRCGGYSKVNGSIKCCACDGRGYNIIIFKNGKRVK
jgi:RecJ-like exonuclease